jgi:hypothetical protein
MTPHEPRPVEIGTAWMVMIAMGLNVVCCFSYLISETRDWTMARHARLIQYREDRMDHEIRLAEVESRVRCKTCMDDDR